MSASDMTLQSLTPSSVWNEWSSRGPEGPLIPSKLIAILGGQACQLLHRIGGRGGHRYTNVGEPLKLVQTPSPEPLVE